MWCEGTIAEARETCHDRRSLLCNEAIPSNVILVDFKRRVVVHPPRPRGPKNQRQPPPPGSGPPSGTPGAGSGTLLQLPFIAALAA